jgi:hypothetical protein
MIQKTIAFETSDKQTFGTVELARQHELELLIAKQFAFSPKADQSPADCIDLLAASINENSEALIDILTMKATSRPKARRVNKKKAAAEATATPATK